MKPELNVAKSALRILVPAAAVLLFSALVLLPTKAKAEVDAGKDAATPNSIVTLPWENAAQKPVPPAFVLPAQSRWGCLACHSNKTLSVMRNGREESLFIDSDVIGNSMHKQIACVDCHTNFTYEDHPADNPKDFRQVAGLACMKCHPYQKYLYEKSVHGQLAAAGKKGKLAGKEVEPALCSSCHGAHDIQSTRFEPYRSDFRMSTKKVCGQCHTDRYDSYSDHYHGQAHKNSAVDAPTCWDCHSNHKITKAEGGDSDSEVSSPAQLRQTCGKCHDNPGESFVGYAPLIHNRQAALDNNPIYRLLSFIIPQRQPAPEQPATREPVAKTEIVTEPPEPGFLSKLLGIFFPKTLRPLSG